VPRVQRLGYFSQSECSGYLPRAIACAPLFKRFRNLFFSCDGPPCSIGRSHVPDLPRPRSQMVQSQGAGCWAALAQAIPSRVGKQCRERWHNHLCPNIRKGSFTEEEVRVHVCQVLLSGYARRGRVSDHSCAAKVQLAEHRQRQRIEGWAEQSARR
jgi:hypothetical protein